MIKSLNSRAYTVAALREIAARMGITHLDPKFRKADIVNVILAGIETAHDQAIAENETREIIALAQNGNYLKSSTDDLSRIIDGYYERMRNRLDHYTRQNGTNRLTARQARRYNKKAAKQGKRLSA
jgi:hypothetical protein